MNTALAIVERRRPDLFHYARGIMTEILPIEERKHVAPYKPNGLWVSVDEPDHDGEIHGWKQWCEAESFGLENLRYRHRIVVRDPDALLWIVGAGELDAFEREYGLDQPYPRDRTILWGAVSEKYPGVVIAPYVWERRLEKMWYYGWDCASGCIWDTSIIDSIELV